MGEGLHEWQPGQSGESPHKRLNDAVVRGIKPPPEGLRTEVWDTLLPTQFVEAMRTPKKQV